MGLLSTLGKLTSFIPIPGAGALGKGLEMAGSVGSVLGKQAQGTAQGKAAQADLNQGQDRNAISLYQAQQQAQQQQALTDLQRKQFESNNRGTSAKQALIGALLGGGTFQPTHATAGGSTGGLLHGLNGNPEALAAMKMLGSQGSDAQSTPLSFLGGENIKAPSLTPVPKIDNGGFLATLAKIGEIAGAVSPYLQPEEDQKRPNLPYQNGLTQMPGWNVPGGGF